MINVPLENRLQDSRELPSFGAQLYKLRADAGMTQSQLAQASQLAASYVSDIENCRRLPPKEKTITQQLGQALGCSAEELNRLVELAREGRRTSGLRVAKGTPSHITRLQHFIANHAAALSPAQAALIEQYAKEMAMT